MGGRKMENGEDRGRERKINSLKRRTFPHEPPKMRPGVEPGPPRCPEADKNSYKTAYRCFLPFAPALLLHLLLLLLLRTLTLPPTPRPQPSPPSSSRLSSFPLALPPRVTLFTLVNLKQHSKSFSQDLHLFPSKIFLFCESRYFSLIGNIFFEKKYTIL